MDRTLGDNCYVLWGLPNPVTSCERGADGSLTTEILGYEISLSIVVERIHEMNIMTEEAYYLDRSRGCWTGNTPVRDDGETWPWPYGETIEKPPAQQFEFRPPIVKTLSFPDVPGVKVAFDCVWSFYAFVRA